MEDLEARVSALEASQADYRAVLAAVNALGANQREMAVQQREIAETQREQGRQLIDTDARVRALEETTSEIKDLLIRALEK